MKEARPRELDSRAAGDVARFRAEVAEACRPVVLRGLVADWPAVKAAAISPRALRDYLGRFDRGNTMEAFFAPRDIGGRYFYSDDLSGFNFERRTMAFGAALDTIVGTIDTPDAPSVYMGSLPVEAHLPGFAAENALTVLGPEVKGRIWIGHASNVSCHYDAFENVACVVAGGRRFTLYPPDAIERPLCRADRPYHGRTADQPCGTSVRDRSGDFPRFETVADQAHRQPNSSPATRCTCRSSGGTRSRPPPRSTCSSITGGTPSPLGRIRLLPRCCSP